LVKLASGAKSSPASVSEGLDSAPPPAWLSWSVWGISALFYLTVFYLRAAPAVMTAELMRDFHIGAAQLGNLSAFYFYFYVAMQIPVGILTDSLGAKRLLICGSLTAAAGTFLFGWTGNFAVACAARAIVGGATAVGWLVLLRLTTHWFPARSFGMMSGLGLFFGNIGALVAQVPLRISVEHFSWRTVEIASSAIVLGIGLVAFVMVRNDPSERAFLSYAPEILRGETRAGGRAPRRRFRDAIRYRNPWLILFAQGGMAGPIMTFTGLWGPPFLRTRFGLTTRSAAAICSVMIVCWAVASPLSGYLSDYMKRRKPVYLGGCALMTIGWIVLLYVNALPIEAFIAVAAFTSFASGAMIVGFAYARESAPIQYMGAITASTNIGNMIGPSVLQPGIGALLDLRWAGTTMNGARVYGLDAFHLGFALIAGWALLSCILIAFTRETNCAQTV
jgi:MFS family permease